MDGYYSEADVDRFREDDKAEIARLTADNDEMLAASKTMNAQAEDLSSRLYRAEAERDQALDNLGKVHLVAARLTAERHQLRAQIAAVIEKAASVCDDEDEESTTDDLEGVLIAALFSDAAHQIRAITPDDAAKSLNQMLNEAYKAGQRDMLKRAAETARQANPGLAGRFQARIHTAICLLPIKERNE